MDWIIYWLFASVILGPLAGQFIAAQDQED
ncbi:hypothetical protein SAMN06298226_2756 [Nitrosovibrio sp. Nv4]|nr:hypothetical protein SAMN06298226_2756 [Nitrosovibrio sp. Nv4]